MTVQTQILDVNNGNTQWNKQNVMDALETAFNQLGFNAGSELTNVPQACISPSGNWYALGTESTDWYDANGGDQPEVISYGSPLLHRYKVIEVGTDYRLLKQVGLSTYAPYHAGMADQATDEIISTRHGFETGDTVRYLAGETDAQYALGTNIQPDTVYYIIKSSMDRFKLADSAVNATNGVALDIDTYASTTAQFSIVWQQEEVQVSDYINPTLTHYKGDAIDFVNDAGNSTNITVCMNTDNFNTNQRVVYNDATYGYYPSDETSISGRINPTNISCVPGATLSWNTASRPQTETEQELPASELNPSFEDIAGEDGTVKYIYCSESTATSKGEIVLIPGYTSASNHYNNYWKYTVPAGTNTTGGVRSELKLRVWRYGYNNGRVSNITIHSVGSGWNSQEIFVIPGEDVGGTATTGDIRFGARTPESSANAYDGTAEIFTTTLGAGSNMYQKSDDGHWGVLRVQNDSTKKYKYTYYAFTLVDSASSSWKLYTKSGSGWSWLNYKGTSASEETGSMLGEMSGYDGLDKQSGIPAIEESGYVNYIDISTSATPQSYPLQIRTYRAQQPQDTNFAIIQFCSIMESIVTPITTFNLWVGDAYGSNTFDLDDVFLGAYTTYDQNAATRNFDITTILPGYNRGHSTYNGTVTEPAYERSLARNALYGYLRGTYVNFSTDTYYHNIDENSGSQNVIYYRNATYDKYLSHAMSSNADWFKPIKNIPISQKMIPCPYYLPEDFALLQVATTPGLTSFRPGDTVTVSGSEVYTIIDAAYQTQQTGLDGISNNSTMGMLFLARTT